ncbi:MAG: phosphoribosylglycinamide formyltransferase [Pseudomonadota bacterium]
MNRKRLAVLISGRGSNMAAIERASQAEDFPAEIVLVLSDNASATGIKTAQDAGIKAHAIPRSNYESKSEHEAAISEAIDNVNPDLICLAGYMRLLSAHFTECYKGKLINIHPSLLPKHKGLDTHARALEAGDKKHGCTVHYVNAEMDGGEIIAQAQVAVAANDTPETLAARVLVQEHRLYAQVIRELCSD